MAPLRLLHVAVALVGVGIATALFGLLAVLSAPFGRDRRWGLAAARGWARTCLALTGVPVDVEGAERLETPGRYVLMANHESAIDIPVLLAAVPPGLSVRFLAKKSLFSIPFLGWGMRAVGFVPVDRERRSDAVQTFDAGSEHLRSGSSLLVFPEETRSRGGELLPFQRGGFLLALKAKLPLVPIGLDGTGEAFPSDTVALRPRRVTVRFGEPIPTAGLGIRDRRELTERTRSEIERLRRPAT